MWDNLFVDHLYYPVKIQFFYITYITMLYIAQGYFDITINMEIYKDIKVGILHINGYVYIHGYHLLPMAKQSIYYGKDLKQMNQKCRWKKLKHRPNANSTNKHKHRSLT